MAPLPKMRSYTKQPSRVAYTIDLPFGDPMDVKESANAWWMDITKLYRLLAAFDIDATIEEACTHVGITTKQYKYFVQVHPEFKGVKKAYTNKHTLMARTLIMRGLTEGNNYRLGMKYLERKLPNEFGPVSLRKQEKIMFKPKMVMLQEDGTLEEIKSGIGSIKKKVVEDTMKTIETSEESSYITAQYFNKDLKK